MKDQELHKDATIANLVSLQRLGPVGWVAGTNPDRSPKYGRKSTRL